MPQKAPQHVPCNKLINKTLKIPKAITQFNLHNMNHYDDGDDAQIAAMELLR